MIQRRALFLGQGSAVIDLVVAGRCDGQRQRFDLQDAVTCIDRDNIVRIVHDRMAADLNADDLCSDIGAGNGICTRACVLLGDQGAVGSIQSAPDRIAVGRDEQIALSAGDVDVGGLARVVVEMLLAGIREAGLERLAGVIVRSGAAGMRLPLVSVDADVDADGLHGQVSGNINNVVISLRIRKSLCTLGNLGILRRRGAAAGVGL